MLSLTRDPIDTAAVLAAVTTPAAGAVVLFLGTTREFTDGRQTVVLEYDCYPQMAEKKLAELAAEANTRWPLTGIAIVHRLGNVPLAEISVAIAVSSPHREAAFAAGKWLIDTLKEVVPIWKKENWADGSCEWVHPGLAAAEETPDDG
jgi:molybdopterin synthase catalytic subunit